MCSGATLTDSIVRQETRVRYNPVQYDTVNHDHLRLFESMSTLQHIQYTVVQVRIQILYSITVINSIEDGYMLGLFDTVTVI